MFGFGNKSKPIRLSRTVKCAGCAAKLSPVLLREALGALPRSVHPDLMIGPDTLDDAAVFRINDELCLIHTADFFPPIVDDPYLFGQIASTNAMSDVYAMGGEVTTVLNLVSFPKTLPLEIMRAILHGAADKVAEAGGVVAGGHTVATEVVMFGQAVTGTVAPRHVTSNAGAKPGETLVLAKALGTGVITTAIKQDIIADADGGAAYASMTQLNRKAAAIMRKHGVRAATDITGFGLLGHGYQMASASGVVFEIDAARVPLLAGALALAKRGVATGALTTNREYTTPHVDVAPGVDRTLHDLMLDPQTSGGLLMSVPAAEAESIVRELVEDGYAASAVIGRVAPQAGGERSVRVRG